MKDVRKVYPAAYTYLDDGEYSVCANNGSGNVLACGNTSQDAWAKAAASVRK